MGYPLPSITASPLCTGHLRVPQIPPVAKAWRNRSPEYMLMCDKEVVEV